MDTAGKSMYILARMEPPSPVLNYAIRGEAVKKVFEMFTAFTHVHMVFMDAADKRVVEFETQPDYAYCRLRQRQPDFWQRCWDCDFEHFGEARQTRRYVIYRCHHGLVEGIVPLFDQARRYLGSIQFGQIRRAGDPRPRRLTAQQRRLYEALPVYAAADVEHLAGLVSCLADYMVQHQIVRFREAGWTDALRGYVREHVTERLAVADLAAAVGRSPSFISHRFRKMMGMSPHKYILRERMLMAKEALARGMSVRQVALDLGYCDEFHFSKVFKAAYGCPPSRWKDSDAQAKRIAPRSRLVPRG